MNITLDNKYQKSPYQVENIENALLKANFDSEARIADSLPVYPITLNIDANGQIVSIELLHLKNEWEQAKIPIPQVIDKKGLHIRERGEAFEEMSINEDCQVLYDSDQGILRLQFSDKEGTVYEIAPNLIAVVDGKKLLSLLLLGFDYE